MSDGHEQRPEPLVADHAAHGDDGSRRGRVPRPDAPILASKIRVPAPVGLVRNRLAAALDGVWHRRLALVVAPAGSGKTTLLAQFASQAGCPVAWYRADGTDTTADGVLRYLEAALAGALPDLPTGTGSVEELGAALERRGSARVLLVVDDLQELTGSPGEAVVARLVELAPPGCGILAATRTPPGFPLSRLRVTGDLVEIGRDDLRFRSWEVEQLFRDVYREPLSPVDLAALARRTDGWAAGLQLFHLATRERRPDERRRVLASLDGRWRLLREYLTDNLLDQLPADLRAFLLETSTLPVLSGPLCDALLGRSGSAAILAELEQRQLFTDLLYDGWYRYHEVLRSHLEDLLRERDGDALVRRRNERAGALLEAAGRPADAVAAYCRAEDFTSVARLLGEDGEAIANDSGAWLERLPASLLRDDPWVLLASARRHRAYGRWRDAVLAYSRAERRFASAAAADIARRERLAITVWAGPTFERRGDLAGLLRAATTADPLAVAESAAALSGVDRGLVAGLAALVAGHVTVARTTLEAVAEDPDVAAVPSVLARLCAALAALLAGDHSAVLDVDRAQRDAERLGQPWLARMAGAVLGLSGVADGPRRAATVAAQCDERGDRWGAALARLLGGLGGARSANPDPAILDAATTAFDALDGRALAAWAAAGAALARATAGDPDAAEAAVAARSRARGAGTDGPELIALQALMLADPAKAAAHAERLAALRATCGLELAGPGDSGDAPAPASATALRLFGGLELTIDGRTVELDALRPRAKQVLRLFALHAGRALHRETIAREMWPDADADTALRNLHVILSQLRTVLEPDAGRGAWSLLVRDGDSYRLQLPAGATVDLAEFDAAVTAGRAAERVGDTAAAVAAFERALDLHADELLPEEGPTEWVVPERERCRAEASDAAQRLAEHLAARGDDRAAIAACVRGLRIDRYRDLLWRTLVTLHERAGDAAAAAQTRRRYEALLAELGIDT